MLKSLFRHFLYDLETRRRYSRQALPFALVGALYDGWFARRQGW